MYIYTFYYIIYILLYIYYILKLQGGQKRSCRGKFSASPCRPAGREENYAEPTLKFCAGPGSPGLLKTWPEATKNPKGETALPLNPFILEGV
jgi:hypothetical protein